jgi:hypothetical protein
MVETFTVTKIQSFVDRTARVERNYPGGGQTCLSATGIIRFERLVRGREPPAAQIGHAAQLGPFAGGASRSLYV